MFVKTTLLVALLVAVSVTARPSERDVPRRDAREAPPLPDSVKLHPDAGLNYYGGAKGTVLAYHPEHGLTPARRQGSIREEEEDVGQEPDTPAKPPANVDNESVVISQPPAGASVAEARPVGIAIAGIGGTASSKPVGTAIVGPGGLAISRPVATAIAGIALPEGVLGPGPIPEQALGLGGLGGGYTYRAGEKETEEEKPTGAAASDILQDYNNIYAVVPAAGTLVPLEYSPVVQPGLFYSVPNSGPPPVFNPYPQMFLPNVNTGALQAFPSLDEGAFRVVVSPGGLEGASTFYQSVPDVQSAGQLHPSPYAAQHRVQVPYKGIIYGVNLPPAVIPTPSNSDKFQTVSKLDTSITKPLYGYVPPQFSSPRHDGDSAGSIAVGPVAAKGGKYSIMPMKDLHKSVDPQQPVSTYKFERNGQLPYNQVIYHPY